jgi:hypothetical protein
MASIVRVLSVCSLIVLIACSEETRIAGDAPSVDAALQRKLFGQIIVRHM